MKSQLKHGTKDIKIGPYTGFLDENENAFGEGVYFDGIGTKWRGFFKDNKPVFGKLS